MLVPSTDWIEEGVQICFPDLYQVFNTLRNYQLTNLFKKWTQNLKEGLQAIEEDQREYTLEEEDAEAQHVILKPDRTKKDADILEKSLSRRYPELDFHEALQEERDKLNIELSRSRTNNDTNQCRVIEHLIDVTENVVNVLPSKKIEKLLINQPTYVISG